MRVLLGMVCLVAFLTIQPLAAGPIQYIESGELSGTLDGVTLTDVSFVFTLDGDTSNIFAATAQTLLNPAISNTIEIGTSDGAFTGTEYAGANIVTGTVGEGNGLTGNNITLPGGVIGYDLASSIGPLTSSTVTTLGIPDTFGTTLGTLVVTSVGNLSFQAVLSSPEPETLALFGIRAPGDFAGRHVEGERGLPSQITSLGLTIQADGFFVRRLARSRRASSFTTTAFAIVSECRKARPKFWNWAGPS